MLETQLSWYEYIFGCDEVVLCPRQKHLKYMVCEQIKKSSLMLKKKKKKKTVSFKKVLLQTKKGNNKKK